MLARKGHFILLLVGTLIFLAALLAELFAGDGGAWTIFRSEAEQGLTASEIARSTVLAKQEAIYTKRAVIKVGAYLAFLALVLGHAVLWPQPPLPYKPTLRETT